MCKISQIQLQQTYIYNWHTRICYIASYTQLICIRYLRLFGSIWGTVLGFIMKSVTVDYNLSTVWDNSRGDTFEIVFVWRLKKEKDNKSNSLYTKGNTLKQYIFFMYPGAKERLINTENLNFFSIIFFYSSVLYRKSSIVIYIISKYETYLLKFVFFVH